MDRMCRVLKVSRGGGQAWSRRAPGAAAQRRELLAEPIRSAHQDGRPDSPTDGRRRGASVSANRGVDHAEVAKDVAPESKAEAVKLVAEQGRRLVEAARDFDIGESTLRGGRQAIAAGAPRAFPGRGHSPALEEELPRLRVEDERLVIVRDI